jgi:ElaB/YqjD/DUF883 family membrane-anchored ribosome-binding protein
MGDELQQSTNPEELTPEQAEQLDEAALVTLAKGEETAEETSEESNEEEGTAIPEGEGPAIQENKRLREKNRELTETLTGLQSQLNAISQKVDQQAVEKPKEKTIKNATNDELLQAEVNLEQKLLQAYQNAQEHGMEEMISKLSDMKLKIRQELLTRPAQAVEAQSTQEKASEQLASLTEKIGKAFPDFKDKQSALFSQASDFVKQNPELFKGIDQRVGEIVAVAGALIQTKSPQEQKGKNVKNVVKEVENIMQSSTSKLSSTQSPKNSKAVNVDEWTDDQVDAFFNDVQEGKKTFKDLS